MLNPRPQQNQGVAGLVLSSSNLFQTKMEQHLEYVLKAKKWLIGLFRKPIKNYCNPKAKAIQ